MPEPPARGSVTGELDLGGHLAPGGIDVALFDEANGRFDARAEATGHFTFSDLSPGLYYLQLDVPGFAQLIRPSIRVYPGKAQDLGALAPVWLQNTPSEAVLKGKVSTATGGGSLLGGQVEFVLEGVNQTVALATVTTDGTFVQRLPPGSYTLVASHPLYVTAMSTGVTLAPAENKDLTAEPIVLGVDPATLSGSVLRERDGLAPTAAPGALITVEATGATTTTDAAGAFQLTGLPAGATSFRVTLMGHHDLLARHAVTLAPGASVTEPAITLALDRGHIAGEVQTADGQAVTDAQVSVVGTPYAATVSVDGADPSRGSFRVANVPVGTYDVVVTKSRYVKASAPSTTVRADETASAGTLTLTVLQGDFVIDDGDAANTAGYTRATQVTLQLSNFTGAATWRASEDPAFIGVAFAPYTGATQPFTLQDTQGTHTVYAQYEDSGGTRSPTFSATIVRDSVPPASPRIVINGGAAFTNQPNPLALTLTASETPGTGVDTVSGLAHVRLSDTGVPDGSADLTTPRRAYLRDLPFVPTSLLDGPRTVLAQFIDNAGNASAIATADVTIDTVLPTGTIAIARGPRATAAGFTNQALVQVALSAGAEPNGGAVQVRLANTTSALSSATLTALQTSTAWFLDPSTEGQKTVYAELRDSAGNTSIVLSDVIVYDVTPPGSASVTLVGAPAVVNAPSVTLLVSASDANGLSTVDGLTASEDALFQAAGTVGPSAMPGTGQLPFTLSAGDGPKRVFARFRDVAGNEAASSVAVALDTTPPTGSLSLVGALADGTPSATLTATASVTAQVLTANASGYRLGNESMTSCPTTAASYTALPAAGSVAASLTGAATPRVMTLCLRDAAGNVGGPFQSTIALDAAAPTGCTLALEAQRAGAWGSNGFTASTNLRGRVSGCAESPTEMSLAVDATPTCAGAGLLWVPFSSQPAVTLPTATETSHSVTLCVRDAARNAATVGPTAITLDTTPPSISASAITQAPTTNLASVTVTVAATDTHGLSHADALTVSEDVYLMAAPTVGPQALAPSVTFGLSTADGQKTVYLRLRDRAGNESFRTLTVTRDTAAPTGSITVQSHLADGTPSTDYATAFAGNPPTVQVLLTSSGATQVAVSGSALTCATASYVALTGAPLTTTLGVAGATGRAYVCLRDDAGNVTASPLTDTIAFDAAGPSGCAVSLSGTMADGVTAAPAGQTARPVVTALVSGCSGAAEYYLVNGTASCSAAASASWSSYSGVTGAPFLLALGDGPNPVGACVRDAARNVSAVSTTSITLDTTPPAALSVLIENDAPYLNALQVLADGGVLASVTGLAVGASQWALSETQSFTFSPYSGAPAPYTFSSTGPAGHTLYAQFRDALGNTSSVVSDTVTVDVTPPNAALGTLSVYSANGAGYINSPAVTLQTVAPPDATAIQVAQDLSAPGCVVSDVSSAPSNATATLTTFGFSAGDGVKRLCARWLDAAGNASALVAAAATLDSAPPSQPQVLTAPRVFNPTAPGESVTQDVVLSLSTLDPQHKAWQVLGGASVTSWTTVTPTSAGPGLIQVPFTLAVDTTAQAGVTNVLRVRELDLADNPSPEASVLMTTDVVPPAAVTLNPFWTDNADSSAVLRWLPSASADVVGYRVYYGAAPGLPALADGGILYPDGGVVLPSAYNGFYAAEGPSPIPVANVDYASLNSLPNGAMTYATVRAVDRAGNVGLAPATGTREVLVQPNEVSPNLLFELQVLVDAGVSTTAFQGLDLAVADDWAYVFGGYGNGSPVGSAVQAVNVGSLVSQVQGGSINPGAPIPTTGAPVRVSDGTTAAGLSGGMALDYPWLYTAAGTHFRVWSVLTPQSPLPIVDMDLSTAGGLGSIANLNAIDVRGNTALVSGNIGSTSVLVHINLSSLYDNNAGTRPSVAGGAVMGYAVTVANSPFGPQGLLWSRDKVASWASNSSNYGSYFDVAAAVDFSAATNLVTSNRFAQLAMNDLTRGNAATSGGYVLMTQRDNLRVMRMTSLWPAVAPYAGGPYDLISYSSMPVGLAGNARWVGSQAFIGEGTTGGIQSVDLTSAFSMVNTGITRAERPATADGLSIVGPYALQATRMSGSPYQVLRGYELAIPRGLHRGPSVDGPMGRIAVEAGLVFSASGTIVDLTTGPVPALRSAPPILADAWAYDAVVFDDTLVRSKGATLELIRTEDATDRVGGTFDFTANRSIFSFPAGTRAIGLERQGNALLAVTVRNTSPLQYALEAYRAGSLRSTTSNTVRTLTASDKLGEYVFDTTSMQPWAYPDLYVRATNGLAVVVSRNAAFVGANTVWLIDARNLLDDSAGTTVGINQVQGTLNNINVKDAVLRGGFLYVLGTAQGTSDQGLYIYDAAKALDASLATKVSNADQVAYVPMPYSDSIDVKGSYAVVTGYNVNSATITALDVSNPAAPQLIGNLPYPNGTVQSMFLDSSTKYSATSTVIAGTRAYVSSFERLAIIELE